MKLLAVLKDCNPLVIVERFRSINFASFAFGVKLHSILFSLYYRYILLHFVWVVYDAKCILLMRICLSVRGRMATLLRGPRCNLGEW